MACPTTVQETVCIGAAITIRPAVIVGEIHTFCVGSAFIGSCPGVPTEHCSFVCSQRLCCQVPLDFHVEAEATPTGLVCGEPTIGGCPIATACTHSIGYWRNNPDERNALITAAGGSIILGREGEGLSFTVTTANAGAVLNFNTPSPPAPPNQPFMAQYQQLYAQLLASKLNVLNEAGCPFANAAITQADNFLATSPVPGGQAGAETIAELLTQYNMGAGPGCPGLCASE